VRDLPTGTVTLLFSDLADSVALTQELGDDYPPLLADSRRLLRAATGQHDAHEVEMAGDHSMFAFRRARDAARAAVSVQRSFHEHRWPGGRRVRVRIALHTGEPTPSDDGYVGMDVQRAWLVCSQAGPGEILVSDATRQLIQDELPNGVVLQPLGERVLGGLKRPERLHRLEVEGLALERAAPARGLPGGTVTFLFSDIEGSTGLMRALGDGWAQAHADHRRLLREAFRRAGGSEVDTQGDAFFAVFPRARAALDAAASAQRSLHEHAWPGDRELRVRMGIHTGEPTVGEEGYLGLDVVRGARICSAAHGGQVLVSETTRALVRGDEPEGVELRDLGDHHLKDVAHPERLYQLAAPGLAQDFPGPRSLDSKSAPPVPVPALDVAARERHLAEQAVAAAQDLGMLGPSIERQVEAALRGAGIPREAGSARARGAGPRVVIWALVIAALAAVGLWLLLRVV
jgi:class 3 adenylate cyclase